MLIFILKKCWYEKIASVTKKRFHEEMESWTEVF